MTLADQDHLQIERDRFGLDGQRRQQAEELTQRLDLDLACAQRAFQPLPGIRLGQQFFRVEHQVATVRARQGARADHREVGDQRAHVGNVIDAADQVLEARLVFEDHWRALGAAVIDAQIDLVAGERQVAGDRAHRPFRLAFRFAQLFGALDDVMHHFVEEGDDILQIRVMRLELLDQMANRQRHRLAAQFHQARLQFTPPARKLMQQLAQLFAVFFDQLVDARLFLVRQRFEVFRPHRLFALQRGEHEALRGAQQRNAVFTGGLTKLAQGLIFAFLVFLLHRFGLAAEGVAVECGGDRLGQIGDETLHVGLQRGAAAGGQDQQPRTVAVGEVIHVA
jgi:hypothetical protein